MNLLFGVATPPKHTGLKYVSFKWEAFETSALNPKGTCRLPRMKNSGQNEKSGSFRSLIGVDSEYTLASGIAYNSPYALAVSGGAPDPADPRDGAATARTCRFAGVGENPDHGRRRSSAWAYRTSLLNEQQKTARCTTRGLCLSCRCGIDSS